jgi:hypothetical protein
MPVRALANESPDYRQRRAELLEAERALRDQIERVAALRRALPEGAVCWWRAIPAPSRSTRARVAGGTCASWAPRART